MAARGSRSVVPARSTLLRALRPGLQVPLANACAFGGVAALVMHVMRTAELSPEAFPVGVALVAGASLLLMRLLFVRSSDAHRARVHAFLWPPVIGALAGATVDRAMWLGHPEMRLAFLGVPFGGDVMEVVAVAVLSGFAGLLGTALLLPQIVVITRAKAATDDAGAHLSRLAVRLAQAAWAIAFAIAATSFVIARGTERSATSTHLVAAGIGLFGQTVRVWLSREKPIALATVPYR
jgi:hypothetical protein